MNTDSDSPRLIRRHRNLPHWTLDGSIYFITFRVHVETLADSERTIVLNHLLSGDSRFYILLAAVIMPDHVHLLLKPLPGFELPRIMKGIKGVSARLINASRKAKETVWQDESWDRIVRDPAELDENSNIWRTIP